MNAVLADDRATLPRGPNRLVASRAAGSLRGDDFHQTPRVATEALLGVETFTGPIWEPARGLGAISAVLEEYGHTVINTDLVARGYGTGRVDFLLEQRGLAPNLVTNPPFKLADAFAQHARRLATGKVALLVRLSWLAGQRRHRLFSATPPARIWVFCARLPMMHRDGYAGPKASSTIDHCWAVFDHAHAGPTILGWLPPQTAIDRLEECTCDRCSGRFRDTQP